MRLKLPENKVLRQTKLNKLYRRHYRVLTDPKIVASEFPGLMPMTAVS